MKAGPKSTSERLQHPLVDDHLPQQSMPPSSLNPEDGRPPLTIKQPGSEYQALKQRTLALSSARWKALPPLAGTFAAYRLLNPVPETLLPKPSPGRDATPQARVDYVESVDSRFKKLAQDRQAIVAQMNDYEKSLRAGNDPKDPTWMADYDHDYGSKRFVDERNVLQKSLDRINTSLEATRKSKLPASLSGTRRLEKEQRQVLDKLRTLRLERSKEIEMDCHSQLDVICKVLGDLPDISRAEAQTEKALAFDAYLIASGIELAQDDLPRNTIDCSYSSYSKRPGARKVLKLPVPANPTSEQIHTHRYLDENRIIHTHTHTHRGTEPYTYVFEFGSPRDPHIVKVEFNSSESNVETPMHAYLPGGRPSPNNAPPDYLVQPSAPKLADLEPLGGWPSPDNAPPDYLVQPSAPKLADLEPLGGYPSPDDKLRVLTHPAAPSPDYEAAVYHMTPFAPQETKK